MQESRWTTANWIGFALSRVVVPLWVLAGASFKLYERTPTNLPSVIVKTARDMQLDLDQLLRVLIGLEFFAAAVMLFIPRLARSMAIFMLSCFVLILLGEMYRQATKCGCFGSIQIRPWQMLLIDGLLLAGVIFFRPGPHPMRGQFIAGARGWRGSLTAAGLLAFVGLALSFAVPDRPGREQIGSGPNGGDLSAPADPQVNPSPAPVPNSWYVRTSVEQEWVGKSWREIDLFQIMQRWPKDLDQGKHYVVFYSRTCDHCRDMFYQNLAMGLDAPVAAVQVPYDRKTLTGPAAWQLPPLPDTVELLDLPLGCSYIITPPLALTVINGTVTCAIEGEGFERCLGKD